eukprot:scaffold31352_cov68-Phaeocystis_antarctica.AAC.3
MKGSVRLARSKSIATHISASLVTGVSSTATRQPQATVMTTTSSMSVTTDLAASMLCVRDSRAMRKGYSIELCARNSRALRRHVHSKFTHGAKGWMQPVRGMYRVVV